MKKIAVVGSGYVGMSISLLFAEKCEVIVLDIDSSRVQKINDRETTVHDELMDAFFSEKTLNISATTDIDIAYKDAELIIVATPTDYDSSTQFFDTSSVELVVKQAIERNKDALVVIKSTIPIGLTDRLRSENDTDRIVFSPEFLREGSALYDNLHPSRIIVGGDCDKAKMFGQLMRSSSLDNNVPLLFMDSREAESVKLFANSYLAMRVSYFNEIDTFSVSMGLNTKSIIDGVGLDPRIGTNYCNPSLGYGGYCLPKDTKQLLANYEGIPQKMIQAVVEANDVRKKFISQLIIRRRPKILGIHRLVMKSGSDNFRSSAIFDVIENISSEGIKVQIYEPTLNVSKYLGMPIINDIQVFNTTSDLVLANRWSEDLSKIKQKVICRDIYNTD
jgi:UDPglucose 6-dehydrogenase